MTVVVITSQHPALTAGARHRGTMSTQLSCCSQQYTSVCKELFVQEPHENDVGETPKRTIRGIQNIGLSVCVC